MDPDWLASLFGPGAMNTSPLIGGTMGPTSYNTPNFLPWLNPGAGGSPTPPLVSSAAPNAPTDSGAENAPAPPPVPPVATAPPVATTAIPPGLQNKATPDSALLALLRGISAPAAPVAQKIDSPRLPTTHAIQAGQLANLLASLGIGPSQLPKLGGRIG